MWGEVSTGWMIASVAGGVWLAGILEYFHVSGEVLIILSVMLLLDYVFWVLDAYLLDKHSVTSTQMWKWLFRKMTRWMLPLIVIAILRGVWAWDLEMVSTVIFSILIITEGYSIIGHIYCINTGKTLPEIDWLEALINFIATMIKGKIPKEIEVKEIEPEIGPETETDENKKEE